MLKLIHRMACLLTSLVVVSSVHAAASNVDWPLIGGNAGVWHYSPLKQINDQNVKQLGLAWVADIPSRDGLVGNPLVADGVVYQSGPLGRVYANDVRSTPQARSPSRLLAFELGGTATATVPPTVVAEFPRPPLPRGPAALAKRGAVYFEAEFCVDCHGLGAEVARSSIPDLRLASAKTHELLPAIVLGGLYKEKGMPAFPSITADEVKAIQAFLLKRAGQPMRSRKRARRMRRRIEPIGTHLRSCEDWAVCRQASRRLYDRIRSPDTWKIYETNSNPF